MTTSATAYLVNEGFEGAGTPASWVTSGTVNFDNTSSPLIGAQSAQITATAGFIETPTFPAQDTVTLRFMWRKAGTPGSSQPLTTLYESGELAKVVVTSSGALQLTASGVNPITGTVLSDGDYKIWMVYDKASLGAVSIYVASAGTTTRPGAAYASTARGVAVATGPTHARLGSGGITTIVDDVVVSSGLTLDQ